MTPQKYQELGPEACLSCGKGISLHGVMNQCPIMCDGLIVGYSTHRKFRRPIPASSEAVEQIGWTCCQCELLIAASDAPAECPRCTFKEFLPATHIPASSEEKDEPKYPCDKCGTLRTKAEGGTTFTVCDECWDAEKSPIQPTAASEEGKECGHAGFYSRHSSGKILCAYCKQEIGDIIADLTRQNEELRRERDEAQRIVADINNSVFGSHSYFLKPDCTIEVEKLKAETVSLRAELQTCKDERDCTQEVIDKLFHMITGRVPEWSKDYTEGDALIECGNKLDALSAELKTVNEWREDLAGKVRRLRDVKSELSACLLYCREGREKAEAELKKAREARWIDDLDSAPVDTAVLSFDPTLYQNKGGCFVALKKPSGEWVSLPGVFGVKPSHWCLLPESPEKRVK